MMEVPGDAVKIMMTFISIVLMLSLVPTLITQMREGATEDQGQYFNLTVISKRVEYERGLFSVKRSFVLILSDGGTYRVPEKLFDMYDTGDPISITIHNGKVTFY